MVWVLVLPFEVVIADNWLSKGEENWRRMKLETDFATQKSGHKEGERPMEITLGGWIHEAMHPSWRSVCQSRQQHSKAHPTDRT